MTTGFPGPDGLWSDILPASPRRGVLAIWILLAALNLSAGVVIASRPERQADLDTIREWSRAWLTAGSNVYESRPDLPEYPPNAIVMLSPLAVIPDAGAVPLWGAINLLLAGAAAWLAMRTMRPSMTPGAAALPIAMCLCWGGFRTLLQFSLLPFTLGLLAMSAARRRPAAGGALLGLALMKPTVAFPFVLWALLTRRWRVAIVGVAVAAAACVVFCLRARVDPFRLVERYAGILHTFYLGDALLVGLSDLRPLITAIGAPAASSVDAIAVSASLALLAVVIAVGLAERGRGEVPLASAPPLAAVWVLLTFYTLTYGFILLLPAAALFLFATDAATRSLRRSAFWLLQLAMMIDVPGTWRRLEALIGPNEPASVIFGHADRVLMLVLFASIVVLAGRRASVGSRLEPSGAR